MACMARTAFVKVFPKVKRAREVVILDECVEENVKLYRASQLPVPVAAQKFHWPTAAVDVVAASSHDLGERLDLVVRQC